MQQQKARRNRGVILTLKGCDKLQTAKAKTQLEKNAGDSFSLEELSDRPHQLHHQKCVGATLLVARHRFFETVGNRA